ncbi:ribonuclease H2 subunit A [Nematocida sp. AWRm77]|nr:ribonuclease H2 subunit A [Nematocida sp. AWRm77]
MHALEDLSLEEFDLLSQAKNVQVQKDAYGNVYVTKKTSLPKEKCFVGIDEAGRGPMAGSLVYAVVFWPMSADPSEDAHVYNDSKKVGAVKRVSLAKSMLADENVGFAVCALSPMFISLNMLNYMRDAEVKNEENRRSALGRAKKKVKMSSDGKTPKGVVLPNPTSCKIFMYLTALECQVSTNPVYVSTHRKNLNDLSLECVSMLLKKYVLQHVSVDTVYMDMLGPTAKSKPIIEGALRGSGVLPRIVIESKADAKYQIVGAASILAKVIRDYFLSTLSVQELLYGTREENIGSGYPADPVTQEWVQSAWKPVLGMSWIARSSWKPVIDVLKEKSPKTIATRGMFRPHLILPLSRTLGAS